MQPVNIVIFSDYICPFCFLANEIIKRIKKKYNLKIDWRPFELHPIRLSMPSIDSDYIKNAWLNVQRLADQYGIEIKLPNYLALSRRAFETAEFAREQGVFDECHDRIFAAYFLEGKNIEEENTLIEIIKDLNLDAEQLRRKWMEDTYLETILNSIRELHSVGIAAVPAFFIGNEEQKIVVGVRSQETLEKIIQKVQSQL
ncbi:MAG TPA: DsbA family protein [Candidatus Deferrimicrobium sp.]|nr:DsbA family protein [Candidatus Deferrimicrobium sp.]